MPGDTPNAEAQQIDSLQKRIILYLFVGGVIAWRAFDYIFPLAILAAFGYFMWSNPDIAMQIATYGGMALAVGIILAIVILGVGFIAVRMLNYDPISELR